MTTLHQYTAKFALSLPETHCSQPFGEGCDVYKVMNNFYAEFSFGRQSRD